MPYVAGKELYRQLSKLWDGRHGTEHTWGLREKTLCLRDQRKLMVYRRIEFQKIQQLGEIDDEFLQIRQSRRVDQMDFRRCLGTGLSFGDSATCSNPAGSL